MNNRLALTLTAAILAVITAACGSATTDATAAKDQPTAKVTASAPPAKKADLAKPAAKPKPAAPKLTSGQKNALRAGQSYVEIMPVSKLGLIAQLSSPAGDGYSKADAIYAANHVKADWNAEAVEAAKNYMEIMPMSKAALIQQLSSPAGDKFTKAQATYAATKVL